jgi:thiol-disulfide isomerase/thioredoxin
MQLIKIQSFLFSLVLIVLLSGCSSLNIQSAAEKANVQDTVNKANNSKLIILDVYHNRCETCKFIEPVFEKLQQDYLQNPDVVFLKYDLSNPFTAIKSKRIAKALGLEQIYKAQRYSGIVLFIDSKTKQVVDSLIGESNIEIYKSAISKFTIK